MITDPLAFMPAYMLRDLISRKELSPVEVIAATLERIDRYNNTLGAFITVTHDLAMQQAKEAEAAVLNGEPLGPLHGIPVPIKDLEGVKGVRFTHGSVPGDEIAESNALCVDRVRAAGGIIVGKTNTPEYGHAGTTENLVYGPARNPWNTQRTSGGSSGGAGAAVAAGLTAVSLGSDGGGSIRIPCAFNGTYGIKATQGRVPRRHRDVYSWNPINNSSVGPISRTVRDSAILLQCLAGPAPDAEFGTLNDLPPDFESAIGRGVKGLKIALSIDLGGAAVDPEVVECVYTAAKIFEDQGARVEEFGFKLDPPEEVFRIFYDFFCARSYAFYGRFVDDPKTQNQLTDYFCDCLTYGRSLSAANHVRALSKVGQYRAYMSQFFAQYDVLLTPTTAVPAFKIGEPPTMIGGHPSNNPRWDFSPFTCLFNLTGNPAASIPCGFSRDSMPIGLQIVGRLQQEETVITTSAVFEETHPWAHKRPAKFAN